MEIERFEDEEIDLALIKVKEEEIKIARLNNIIKVVDELKSRFADKIKDGK